MSNSLEQAIPTMRPPQFIQAVADALEDEDTTQRFAAAHQRLFEAVRPLSGISQQAATLRKQEKFLKRQINTMKDELRLRKQIDEDGSVIPRSVLRMFHVKEPETGEESASSEDADDDDDDDNFLDGSTNDIDAQGGAGVATSKSVAPSLLRKELLDSGVPTSTLNLDSDALVAEGLDVVRMTNEIVLVPYLGTECLLYALKPSDDGDVTQAVQALRALVRVCDRSTPTLSRFVGATDFEEHVICALAYPGGSSLKRIARSTSDGDLKVSPALQVALARDLALATQRLHEGGVVHGAIRAEGVVVTLYQPCGATLVYTGLPGQGNPTSDIFDLGLVFASLALGRLVTAATLPSAADLRAAANAADVSEPPFESFCELIVQMTQSADASLRPTAVEAAEWLRTIMESEDLDEYASRMLESASLGSVPAIFELQRDMSPLRRL